MTNLFEKKFINANPMGQTKELPEDLLKLIENAPLDPDEKMELILIKQELKPVTSLTLYSSPWEKDKGEEKTSINKERIKKIEILLEKLGLAGKIAEPEIDEFTRVEDEELEKEIAMRREKIDIFFAKDRSSLEKLAKAVEDNDGEQMGISYGYPKTAVEAYLGKIASIKRQDLPKEIKEKEYYPFIQFEILSKDNWQEEIKTAELWANTVKKISSKLFNEYVQYISQ